MRQLVYGYLWIDRERAKYPSTNLLDMAVTWAGSLRTLGRYSGDIGLITNVPDEVRIQDVNTFNLKFADETKNNSRIILSWECVPFRQYDQLLRLDLDIIAVNPIAPLFASDACLWAAPSQLSIFDKKHALKLIPLHERAWRRITGRLNVRGVSSCAYSCTGGQFERHHRAWSETIKSLRHLAPRKALHEQMYLNYMLAKGITPIRSYTPTQIQHCGHVWSPDAILFHYPKKDRHILMKEGLSAIPATSKSSKNTS